MKIFAVLLCLFSFVLCLPAVAQEEKPLSDEIKALIEKAEGGDVEAQFNLGLMYANGDGVLEDDKEAVKWYRKAADQGHADGQVNLGFQYAYGHGVLEDKKEAVKWYRKAADQGNAVGQYNLGAMYARGVGVLEDDKEAVKWYRKAADQGYAKAQFYLGLMYVNGYGVLEDRKEAVKWYRKAADQGHAGGQVHLGIAYYNGSGVLEDKKEAVRWYRKAADQGNPDAQMDMAFFYAFGVGVLEDKKEAVKWYRKAADQGNPDAQFHLGYMYSVGEGVLEDHVTAYAWWNIAAFNGEVDAKEAKGSIAKEMTPEQIAEAQKLSKELLKRIASQRRGAASKNGPQSPTYPEHLQANSQGTGFAVTKDGLILTAFHVIAGARRIRVTLDDGRSFSAAVESSSQSNDLALLKVDAKDLTALSMSSSRSINVGEELFTVGYPVISLLGRDAKYTSGALSSKSGIKGESSLMQITVPIQPGNSGGPVVTSKGQVVGIVTSTAAIEAFFKVTGSLPQNINWAIKAEYASLMFEANDKIADTPSLDKAIERAMKAVCLVEAWTETK